MKRGGAEVRVGEGQEGSHSTDELWRVSLSGGAEEGREESIFPGSVSSRVLREERLADPASSSNPPIDFVRLLFATDEPSGAGETVSG